jgi:purine catabolism regulator
MGNNLIGITLREALKLGPLRQAVVLGGSAGLDRIVTTVTVMETDDAYRLLNGNELLVTAFFAVRDNLEKQLHWLDELARRGCAGVIFCYIGRYFNGDIEALSRRADELALPLLTVPGEKVLYSDIILAVLTELLQRQTKRLEYALSVHDRLTQEALMGASLETLIRSLAGLLESTVIATDADFHVIATSPFGEEGKQLLKALFDNGDWKPEIDPAGRLNDPASLVRELECALSRLDPTDNCSFDVSLQPIQVGQTLSGYVLLFKCGGAINEEQEFALKHGMTVIALERVRAESVKEMERRLQGDLLDEVLHGSMRSPEITASRGLSLGIDLEDKRVVMVVSIENGEELDRNNAALPGSETSRRREGIYRLVDRIVRQASSRNVVVGRGRRIVVLIGVDSDSLASKSIQERTIALGEAILEEFERVKPRGASRWGRTARSPSATKSHEHSWDDMHLSIGVGSICRHLSDLHHSYNDALQAIEMGRRLFGPGQVMHIDDLSFYSVLDFASGRKESQQIVNNVLGPLMAYDVANGTDLLKTLEMLCLSGESRSEVARKLYIHRNTLAYRQARIKEILGFDPFSGAGQIRTGIALVLNKLREAGHEES